jgi:hypothetical protein
MIVCPWRRNEDGQPRLKFLRVRFPFAAVHHQDADAVWIRWSHDIQRQIMPVPLRVNNARSHRELWMKIPPAHAEQQQGEQNERDDEAQKQTCGAAE